MGNPVVHFEVLGEDAAKLSSFYGELFDRRRASVEKQSCL